jgi:hypothetical protein
MDILTMNNGGVNTIETNTGMNRDTTALRRLSEIAQVFTSNQAPQNPNNNIADVLRSNKRNNSSLASEFPMPRFGNVASLAPSSALRTSSAFTGNDNPFKRTKLDSTDNPMARLLLLQQQQRQLQHHMQLDQHLQHQQQTQSIADDNSGSDDVASNEDGASAEDEDDEVASATAEPDGGVRFREYQAEIWSEKFEELCLFRRQQGHCHVPHHYMENLGLAQWVKRQRYQYKLKLDGKRSTLSDERVRLLNQIGFIWNSHDAVWEERLQDLMLFKQIHGHCMVPSNFEPNVQLAIWIKRQRRQYKKYTLGEASSMTPERIARLEAIGFVWDCRKQNKQQQAPGVGVDLNTTSKANTATATTSAQQQQQLLLMRLQLIQQQQAARAQAGVEQEESCGGKAAHIKEESDSLAEQESKRDNDDTDCDANNEASAVDQAQQQHLQQELPVRMPRCEFFSFSRKFKY